MNELSAFRWPNLSEWRGLPPDCTLAMVRAEFTVPADDWYATGYLGEEPREYRWRSAMAPTFPDSVRVWYADDRVVVLDSEVSGDARRYEGLVAKLGEPEATLDTFFGNAALPGAEWVYPDRGLALHIEPETQVVLWVAGYPATTLDAYRKRYRIVFKPALKYREGLT